MMQCFASPKSSVESRQTKNLLFAMAMLHIVLVQLSGYQCVLSPLSLLDDRARHLPTGGEQAVQCMTGISFLTGSYCQYYHMLSLL